MKHVSQVPENTSEMFSECRFILLCYDSRWISLQLEKRRTHFFERQLYHFWCLDSLVEDLLRNVWAKKNRGLKTRENTQIQTCSEMAWNIAAMHISSFSKLLEAQHIVTYFCLTYNNVWGKSLIWISYSLPSITAQLIRFVLMYAYGKPTILFPKPEIWFFACKLLKV